MDDQHRRHAKQEVWGKSRSDSRGDVANGVETMTTIANGKRQSLCGRMVACTMTGVARRIPSEVVGWVEQGNGCATEDTSRGDIPSVAYKPGKAAESNGEWHKERGFA